MDVSKFLTAGVFIAQSVFFTTTAYSKEAQEISKIEFDSIEHKDFPLWEGVSSAVVSGNPKKAGLFSTHAWMADQSIVPPHTHPDARITLVTHGTMYVGAGETYDQSKLVAYAQGSVFLTPANVPQFMWAKDGAVAVMDIGAGPTGIELIE